jgi:probable lipoprotein NlpC
MVAFFCRKGKELPFYLIGIFALLLLSACATQRKARVHDTKVDKVVATARSYIGTPYKYGGTSRAGLDCSGLLLNSFRAISVELPRTSDGQSKIGKEVKLRQVEAGDLVFFATGKWKRKITHVGMVTDRRGAHNIKFIHASSSLGVIEADIFTAYYLKHFREARRVID